MTHLWHSDNGPSHGAIRYHGALDERAKGEMTTKGTNLHLYPSPLLHESRIEREVLSISKTGLFERIEVAGVVADGLPQTEEWVANSRIRRLGTETATHSLTARLGKTAAYGRSVLHKYGNESISVINCHSLPTLPAALALKAKTGAALVYDTHELETETTMSTGARRPMLKAVERLGIRGVDHTFVVSKMIEDWYRSKYGLTQIDTLYNYPMAARLPSIDRAQGRARLGVKPDTFLCIYQGVIAEGRGIEQILAAFSGNPPGVAVLFVGYGDGVSLVKSAADQSESIFFHPAVPSGELIEYTMLADVGLSLGEPAKCLSYDYSAPNKFYQYLHAGIPVIVSRLPEQMSFLATNPVGVVARSLCPSDILEAVDEVRAWPPGMLNRELDRARKLTSWSEYDNLFQHRYEELLTRSPRMAR